MELDARGLGSRVVESDICVVGAGPAGLTLANQFVAGGFRVVVLESGGRRLDLEAQALSEGETFGDPYPSPSLSRQRRAGGTAHSWNTWLGSERMAKYVPLDPIDFEEREWLPMSGWPFPRTDLDPYYQLAHTLCRLGPYTYRASDWAGRSQPALPIGQERIATGVYQLGSARAFTSVYLDDARQSSNVLLCLNTSVVEIVTDPSGENVTHLRARSLYGEELQVRARFFVLASGGIENARLLLLSNRTTKSGIGNRYDMVGRCFMDHPRLFTCALFPRDLEVFDRCGFYDVNRTPQGVYMGRLALVEETMRREHFMNVSIALRPRPRPVRVPSAPWSPWHWTQPIGRDSQVEPTALADRFGAHRYFELQVHLEQAPDPLNRVKLGSRRDAHGLSQVEIHWKWNDVDQRNLTRILALVAEEVARAGVGRLEIPTELRLDSNVYHHMGSTRMHRNPRLGVVDADARVHGTSNLFVAGSSVFPTSGSANPTLTIVALSLRLADHLKGLLGAEILTAAGFTSLEREARAAVLRKAPHDDPSHCSHAAARPARGTGRRRQLAANRLRLALSSKRKHSRTCGIPDACRASPRARESQPVGAW